ncbi:pancreatic secretory granule membrane major glycoprotein GP2 isoform X2 [Embiotoca jacksoni]|uniref:pancreatic secretory granule membrane major glycoprotein GP2 isoform X2 n=1 Tax=Embiotoca jacksoni TaxID=100190 RepID=UPI0037046999
MTRSAAAPRSGTTTSSASGPTCRTAGRSRPPTTLTSCSSTPSTTTSLTSSSGTTSTSPSCAATPVNYMVQQPNGANMIRVDVRTITLNTEDGNFSVSMLLYKDEAFENRWTTVPSLTLDDNIFVKVFMLPAHLMLRMERCWATPTSDPYSNVQYTFIRDSCPVLTGEQTLSMLKNGLGPDAAFRIQMFKFVGGSYANVFLHCNVQICHGGPRLCRPNCSGEDASLRARRDVPLSHTVSYGPIRRILNDSEKPNLNAGGVPAVETFVLGGLLLVLLLVTGMLGRLWLHSRQFYPAREAQLTLSNIQHISEVAS